MEHIKLISISNRYLRLLTLLYFLSLNGLAFNVQALDTLGTTKWRVNKRVLSVIEAIWSAGGRTAGLVDCKDVSTKISLQYCALFLFIC